MAAVRALQGCFSGGRCHSCPFWLPNGGMRSRHRHSLMVGGKTLMPASLVATPLRRISCPAMMLFANAHTVRKVGLDILQRSHGHRALPHSNINKVVSNIFHRSVCLTGTDPPASRLLCQQGRFQLQDKSTGVHPLANASCRHIMMQPQPPLGAVCGGGSPPWPDGPDGWCCAVVAAFVAAAALLLAAACECTDVDSVASCYKQSSAA